MIIGSALVIASVIAASLLFAALHDVVTRTVPNWVSVAILACGLSLQAHSGHLLVAALAGGAVFGVTAILWFAGWLGGADVKLLAVGTVAVPPAAIGSFLLAVSLAGGILAVIYLALARIVSRPSPGPRSGLFCRALKAEAWRISRRGPLPYATAIAAGALFTLFSS